MQQALAVVQLFLQVRGLGSESEVQRVTWLGFEHLPVTECFCFAYLLVTGDGAGPSAPRMQSISSTSINSTSKDNRTNITNITISSGDTQPMYGRFRQQRLAQPNPAGERVLVVVLACLLYKQ